MQKLTIDATVKAPKVHFDNVSGILEISGKSIPENAHDLYQPMLVWLDKYLKEPASNTTFIFKLSYFNSSSTEYILEMMKRLESLHNRGFNVSVKWFHDQDDEDMEQVGADFRMMLHLPIEMVVNEEED
jgi:hypothetical protein